VDFVRKIMEKSLSVPVDEGPNKVTSLKEAVGRLVEPGMVIHAAATHSRPNAVMHEIIRRFWGADSGFTIVSLAFGYSWVALVRGGLVKRIISAFIGDHYPTPGPNPVLQKAYREGTITLEKWSMLSLSLRLMAAAMGVPFLPTRSIVGSTMAEENVGSFVAVKDDASGRELGLVHSLTPDLSIVHGLAADRQGNTILTPPLGDNLYGAMAAWRGALVTVERIVSTDFIRRYNHLVKLPGRYVSAVCEVPFGAHPTGVSNCYSVTGIHGYAEDYGFEEEVRSAARSEKVLDSWIHEWILSGSQTEYLAKLGPERLHYLKGKADRGSWKVEIEPLLEEIAKPALPTNSERLVAAAAEKLIKIIQDRRYDTILAGVGIANLAAWLAAKKYKAGGGNVDLVAEIGFYGTHPQPADPFVFNQRNLYTATMLTDIFPIMGILVSGSRNKSVGVFGAGQIDKFGNVNTTIIPETKTLLVGSGGANDAACGANESLVTMVQEKDRMVEKVPYITSPGKRIKTLVTTHGIYEKLNAEDEFTLTAVLTAGETPELETLVRKTKETCGWNLVVANEVKIIPPPELDDLTMLRLWDPKGLFLKKGI